ncbi:unnamed protein product [Didymodactylos carnosus]|uniref:DNA polymerase alpha subunit B n=1 Tax=Didymodactylos carnosus TaxID=1234261 RepID=A0A813T0F8_9BILA|nr:unnamed protein product [Didymodactylos carnosus]CAF0807868.1 unnamed protein product [Didymodactylos carnosus]CAF3549941.1 unnamed protein product [Didymodactylos carnosus]CAF3593393.1 unnamed protein product [Didymodactylos carnosus]
MDDFPFDVDDIDNEKPSNVKTLQRKSERPSGIALDSLEGLLESYSSSDIRSARRSASLLANPVHQSYPSTPIRQVTKGVAEVGLGGATKTPVVQVPTTSMVVNQTIPNTPTTLQFESRINKNEIITEHIGSCSKKKMINDSDNSVDIQLPSSNASSLYMFQTVLERASVLNKQIEKFEDLYMTTLNIDPDKPFVLYSVGHPESDEVSVVGRICCDSVGQLNEHSIILEGSYHRSTCNRVRVDVSSLDSYSFFPGQIVLISGIYTNDGLFHAKQIIEPTLPPIAPTLTIKNDFTLMVAAGPFLLANGDFSALNELLSRANIDRPTVLILLGPFVDERSSYVQKLTDKTYDEIFHSIINEIKRTCLNVVLIPSVRDIHHDSVYPCYPFQTIDQNSKIMYAPEPCLLSINGLQCAITSTDVLFHLCSEEISSNPVNSDRMSRLTKHLLQQRLFYPLCPPHESISIEYGYAMDYASIPFMPHILITTSDLKQFIKFVDSVCVINTGRLIKSEKIVGGSYSKIFVSKTDSQRSFSSNDHLHVQILRL